MQSLSFAVTLRVCARVSTNVGDLLLPSAGGALDDAPNRRAMGYFVVLHTYYVAGY